MDSESLGNLRDALAARTDVLTNVEKDQSPTTDEHRREQARQQLQQDVNALYERLAELQLELNKLSEESTSNGVCPPDPIDPHTSIEQAKARQLAAEVEHMKEAANVLPEFITNPYVLEEELKEDMRKNYRDLMATRDFVKAQGESLQIDEQNQKQINEELTMLKTVLQDKIKAATEARKENKDTDLDLENKKTKIYAYTKKLMKEMALFTNKHYPQPSDEQVKEWTKKNKMKRRSGAAVPKFTSLQNVLERLMNSSIESPNDSYITIDETHFPPYIEMLLRSNIAQRHPADCNKIRLLPFHL